MSVWVDIHKRSTRDIDRKEDDIRIMIKSVLSSYVVGPNQSPPVRQFMVNIIKDDDNKLHQYTIVLKSCIHPDGTKDFCNEENLEHILKILKLGKIIDIR